MSEINLAQIIKYSVLLPSYPKAKVTTKKYQLLTLSFALGFFVIQVGIVGVYYFW